MRSSSITLYIDTSSSYLYTGIVKDGCLLVERKENFSKDLSTYALYCINQMMEEVSLSPKDIQKVIVVNGPGSFTGVRIGVTIAKTFAWAQKKEIIPISSLEAMAISSSFSGWKVPCIDARRGYVYAGIYNEKNEVVLEDQYLALSDLVKKLELEKRPYCWIRNDDWKESDQIERYDPDILRIVESVKSRKSVNPHGVNPVYLKRTEAEETKGIKVS